MALTNPYLIAVVIPLLLIVSQAVAKKLVRGSNWQKSDFFLGVELSLSAIATALVYVFDLAKLFSGQSTSTTVFLEKVVATTVFVALCFFVLLWVLSIHQDWEKRNQNPAGQLVWLGIIANSVGASLLVTFVLLVKGV